LLEGGLEKEEKMKKETSEKLFSNFLLIFTASAVSLFASTLYNNWENVTIASFIAGVVGASLIALVSCIAVYILVFFIAMQNQS